MAQALSVPSTPVLRIVTPGTPGAPVRRGSAGVSVSWEELTSSSPPKLDYSSAADDDDNVSVTSTASSPAALNSQSGSNPVTPATTTQATTAPSVAPVAPAAPVVSAATFNSIATAAVANHQNQAPANFGTFQIPAIDFQLYSIRQMQFERAQMTFSANCAMFVGNLDNKYVDAQLCEMLIRRFIIFGPVYVKINRLSKESHRPTAILQFTDMSHAQTLERTARNSYAMTLVPGGRRLRVERSSAVKSIVVSRWDGLQPSPLEIQAMFGGFAVKSYHTPTPAEAINFKLDACVIVDFANFGHMKEALRQYHQLAGYNGIYRMGVFQRT